MNFDGFTAIGKGIGSIFSGAAAWITPVNTGLEIIKQITGGDSESSERLARVYIEELRCKTIPIVDAFHKMGRQLTIWAQMAFYFYCAENGIEITQELVMGVSSTAGIYAFAKGSGK